MNTRAYSLTLISAGLAFNGHGRLDRLLELVDVPDHVHSCAHFWASNREAVSACRKAAFSARYNAVLGLFNPSLR
jgi:hypothetical protein